MSTKRFICGLAALLFCFVGGQQATASTTGKIVGRVTDAHGEPLPGANVIIQGTRQGATTNAGGFYTILLVEPGSHDLEATMVGYGKVVKQNVTVVNDYTTTVDFQLKESTISAKEIVVEATRPPVEPDKTASKYYVTSKDIEMMPVVRSAHSWAGLQPGVQADGRSVRMGVFNSDEGERNAGWYTTTPKPISLTYTVDGVRMVNNDSRAANMFTGVDHSAIQEISVVTGVPEAEYGDMTAGIVNIITKEGGRQFHSFLETRYTTAGKRHFGFNAYDPLVHIDPSTGKSRIQLENPQWLQERENIGPDGIPGTADDTGRLVHVQPQDYTNTAGYRLEGSVSGPISPKATFHLSVQSDREPAQRPNPALRDLPNIQTTGKLAFSITPTMTLKVGGVYGKSRDFRVTQDSGLGSGRDIYLPPGQSGAGQEVKWNSMEYAVLTHSLSPKTLYEVRFSRSDSKSDTLNVPEDTFNIQRDAEGWFTVAHQVRDFRLDRQTRYNLKADFSSQVTKGNFFKMGVAATWFRTWEWEQDSNGTAGHYTVWSLYDYAKAAANQYGKDGKMDYVGTRTVQGVTLPDFSNAGTLDDPAWNAYQDYPMHATELSAYLQDKMEFEGLVVNVGLRMDSFFHRSQTRPEPVWSALPSNEYFSDAQNALYRESQTPYPQDPTAFPTWGGRNMFQLEPRFGISHPITARSAIHFSYGRFFVLPIFYSMYGQTWQTASGESIHEDLNSDGRLSSYEYYGGLNMGSTKRGSSQVRPGKATNYEVGMDWNFVSDYTASATMYFRRTSDYLQQDNTFLWDPVAKSLVRAHWYENAYSGETRGLELALNKRFSKYFSFRATYSWYFKQNNFYGGPDAVSRWYLDSDFLNKGAYRYKYTIDPQTGTRIWQPLTDQEIASIGNTADQQIVQLIADNASVWISQKYADQVPGAQVGLPFTGEKDITATTLIFSGVRGPANKRDAPSDGSISVLLATPPGFGPSAKGFHPLSGLNANLVLHIQPGNYFEFNSPTPSPSTNGELVSNTLLFTNATTFTTDLGVQKAFQVGRFQPMLYFEATNLFNGKQPVPIKRFSKYQDIPKFGLPYPEPTPVNVREDNAIWDQWDSYQNLSRQIYFGLRMRM